MQSGNATALAAAQRPTGILKSAFAAAALGALAVTLVVAVPLVAAGVGLGAMAAGLLSRQRLRADAASRGSRLSMLGFVLGLAAVLVVAVPILLPFALMLRTALPS